MPDPQTIIKTEHKKRITRQKKGVLRFLLLFAALAFACGVTIGISYLFRIRVVEITGNARYSSEELLAAANVRIGAPLSSLDEKGISDKLKEEYVWIRDVSVDRNLFGKVNVCVNEYTAAYVVRAENGDFLVSEDFVTLERVGGDLPEDTPVLLLSAGRYARIGEVCSHRKEEPTAASRISKALSESDGLPSILWIDLSSPYYYKLLCEGGVTVVLGDTESLSVKLELAVQVLSRNEGKSWTHAEVNVADVKRSTFRIID